MILRRNINFCGTFLEDGTQRREGVHPLPPLPVIRIRHGATLNIEYNGPGKARETVCVCQLQGHQAVNGIHNNAPCTRQLPSPTPLCPDIRKFAGIVPVDSLCLKKSLISCSWAGCKYGCGRLGPPSKAHVPQTIPISEGMALGSGEFF